MEQFNGPWKIGNFDSIKDCNNKEVRAYGITLSDSDQARINARLIAAAPEILEALKECMDELYTIHSKFGDEQNARDHSAALSKSEIIIQSLK